MSYEAIIGLEVHAQVQSRSKMYCACPVVEDTGDLQPNTYVCPVCLALPGSLPVVNRRAVELGVQAALALHCTVAPESVFARKSYFYPDLPKGYQITQFDEPIGKGGYMDLEMPDGTIRRVRIHKLHLEEDAGKTKNAGKQRFIDFNRCGVPLVEMVTEPDLRSADEAAQYLIRLRQLLRWLGVSDGDM